MQKIDKLIRTSIKKYKIEDKIKNYEVYRVWEPVLTKHLPEAKQRTMVTSFERGILNVAVLSKELADVICLYQPRLLSELNNTLGKNLGYRIYCQS
jgi:hypothetical protein